MKIQLATKETDLAECLALRRQVFVKEQNVPQELELDGMDKDCLHVMAIDNGETIGTARFHPVGLAIKVQRVCVPEAQRGKGIGAKVMQFIVEEAKREGGAHSIKLSSQKSAVVFYEKLGFSAYGDEYMDAGIPHVDMELKL